MNIFIIAVINEEPERKRTWGWYERFEDAEKAVIENHTDIFECGYYDLAVIEEMPEGVCAIEENTWWYRAIYPPEGRYPVVERINAPARFEQDRCLTMSYAV
jgi:hypothetical protein